jgi:hypothetical protein
MSVMNLIGFILFIPYALKLRKFSGEREFYTLSDWFSFKLGKTVALSCIYRLWRPDPFSGILD